MSPYSLLFSGIFLHLHFIYRKNITDIIVDWASKINPIPSFHGPGDAGTTPRLIDNIFTLCYKHLFRTPLVKSRVDNGLESAKERRVGIEYSVKTIEDLKKIFKSQNIGRPLRERHYDPETEITFAIKGVFPARQGKVKLKIEKAVGGGYAGQVYKARVISLETPEGPIEGLSVGQSCALKILIPPKGFARLFRNLIYALGFQAPFSLQVNPTAARSGALWQKFIRRAAGIRLGTEKAVVNILATLVDPFLGSCGEISEWIDGRMWRFEVDDNLDARSRKKDGQKDSDGGSPEYLSKKRFMARLVSLMHDMGAEELARQYEWWTCKSQPNALKRFESDPDPCSGLVAVDFRAGLALLPFFPQSPVDFKLILKGILRGRLVQFDRGNVDKLTRFIHQNPGPFSGMELALEELRRTEAEYRESMPDITHHHLKLLYSRRLWSAIRKANIRSWRIRNITDDRTTERLSANVFLALLFSLLGLIPFVGRFFRRLWGRRDIRRHYGRVLSSLNYFRRTVKAWAAERLIKWHRAGRVEAARAIRLAEHPLWFLTHLPLSLLPPGLHRFFTDRRSFIKSLDNIFVRPFRLYFKSSAREEWMRDMIAEGQKEGLLTEGEASSISAQIKEPFIQKYLKSMAVHVCTLPVTQIVSLAVAYIYVRLHPELSWQEASLHAGLILGLFQVTPISPGSIVRGLYVTFLVLRERNFKDYKIAFALSFFKYIGYLAFPIQMAYRYADLARFMAGHWATGAVHIVPVFGERGALLEHAAFDLFFNYPLTIRRRLRERFQRRTGLKTRTWHLPICILGGLVFLAAAEILHLLLTGRLPSLGNIWWIVFWAPLLVSAAVTAWAGGARLPKRILMSTAAGTALAVGYALITTALRFYIFPQEAFPLSALQFLGRAGMSSLWKIFLFSFLAVGASLFMETKRLR